LRETNGPTWRNATRQSMTVIDDVDAGLEFGSDDMIGLKFPTADNQNLYLQGLVTNLQQEKAEEDNDS
jgi:hypothetical protein